MGELRLDLRMECMRMPVDTKSIITLKKGDENMVHKAIKQQRDKNITVWISRKLHVKVKRTAFNMGVSITWVLNKILKDYFGRKK